MAQENIQYDMFDKNALSCWCLHEGIITPEMIRQRKHLIHRPLPEIKEYVQGVLEYFKKVDSHLTQVANTNPFYNILASRIGFHSVHTFGKLEQEVQLINNKNWFDIFARTVALDSVAPVVQYFINNMNTPLLGNPKQKQN